MGSLLLNGNKLDSVNYTTSTAWAKYICNKTVAASHHSGKYYRDMPLFIPSIQLKKKQYAETSGTSDYITVYVYQLISDFVTPCSASFRVPPQSFCHACVQTGLLAADYS